MPSLQLSSALLVRRLTHRADRNIQWIDGSREMSGSTFTEEYYCSNMLSISGTETSDQYALEQERACLADTSGHVSSHTPSLKEVRARTQKRTGSRNCGRVQLIGSLIGAGLASLLI